MVELENFFADYPNLINAISSLTPLLDTFIHKKWQTHQRWYLY